jgi:hypothetical protein
VFRELHVTTLGAHSPSTCEQPQGQSSFHTWLWFAAHFAASACAEVTQGEALLLDFTIEGELPASRRCACRTPPGTSSASGWSTTPKQSGRLDYAGSSSTTRQAPAPRVRMGHRHRPLGDEPEAVASVRRSR